MNNSPNYTVTTRPDGTYRARCVICKWASKVKGSEKNAHLSGIGHVRKHHRGRRCCWCDLITPDEQPMLTLVRMYDDKVLKWCVTCADRVGDLLQEFVRRQKLMQYRTPL